MATKIFYNDNRIIIDGHADTPTECQAITAMCDSLVHDENFKTIVYEKGHAVFERVDGGDSMMFEALQKQLDELSAYVKTIKSCTCDLEKFSADYLTKNDAAETYETIEAHINSISLLQETIDALEARITALESAPKSPLNYSAEQLNALLAKLENH